MPTSNTLLITEGAVWDGTPVNTWEANFRANLLTATTYYNQNPNNCLRLKGSGGTTSIMFFKSTIISRKFLMPSKRRSGKGKKRLSCMKRYFVSSLDAAQMSAERFLELSCRHWQIENRLHLIKDRWWDEDKHVLFRPGLGEIWSALTDLALSLLWAWGRREKPLRKKRWRSL